jgi:mannose-6-phosphate isomerase
MRIEGFVEKGWGGEFIFATNDLYCGKLLRFNTGAKFSMHFHDQKDETWLVLEGEFELKYIDTKDASMHSKILKEGDVWRNYPLEPHQLICIEQGVIIEVSTPDSVEDNYRVLPGDSQSVSKPPAKKSNRKRNV